MPQSSDQEFKLGHYQKFTTFHCFLLPKKSFDLAAVYWVAFISGSAALDPKPAFAVVTATNAALLIDDLGCRLLSRNPPVTSRHQKLHDFGLRDAPSRRFRNRLTSLAPEECKERNRLRRSDGLLMAPRNTHYVTTPGEATER